MPIAGDNEPKFRERVYGYELYHQLRCLLSANNKMNALYLCGELDKGGHSIIKERKIPDLLVHLPGEMKDNLAVVEMKPLTGLDHGIKKDLDTLKLFVSKYQYAVGFHLVYGHGHIDRFIRAHRPR